LKRFFNPSESFDSPDPDLSPGLSPKPGATKILVFFLLLIEDEDEDEDEDEELSLAIG
jgi:hypothetical protein